MIQIPLMPLEEISRRLTKIKVEDSKRGRKPKGYVGISFIAIEKFCEINRERIKEAARGKSNRAGYPISKNEHIKLSMFFHRWDKGEISFVFNGQEWETLFHKAPIPRAQYKRCVIMTPDGPKFEWVIE